MYDVWVDLWGQPFADGQVKVEGLRKGIVDYEGAWKRAALSARASGTAFEGPAGEGALRLPGPTLRGSPCGGVRYGL